MHSKSLMTQERGSRCKLVYNTLSHVEVKDAFLKLMICDISKEKKK